MTALLAKSFWMPEDASTVAGEVDSLFGLIYWICVFFFVLITVLLVAFVLRYRHRRGRQHDPSGGHSTTLELTWTIIPTILVLVIFYQGFRGYLNMSVEPPNPYQIDVIAETWNWTFLYPNGAKDNKLHLPLGVPVRLVLQSKDVIHSLYIPAFRVKKDAVPGRYNRFWVQATQVSPDKDGFDLYCAEYCGQNHSTMLSKVIVHPTIEDFEAWAKEAGNWEGRMTYLEAGESFIKSSGCLQCHALGDKGPSAPGFKDLFGNRVPILGQGSVLADENYIKESIVDPQAKIREGYPKPSPMNSFRAQLGDRDINAIIAYLKSNSVHYKGDLEQYKKIAKPATQPATQSSKTQPSTGQGNSPASPNNSK